MKILLWLDDVRDPLEDDWLVFSPIGRNINVFWVKSYEEFTDWITSNGLPDGVCFDHDLADVKEIEGSNLVIASDWNKEKTGYDCAKWLVDYCMSNDLTIPPYNVHSANPVGAENIRKYIENAKKYLNI